MKYLFAILLCVVGTFVRAQTFPNLNGKLGTAITLDDYGPMTDSGQAFSLSKATALINLLIKLGNAQQHIIDTHERVLEIQHQQLDILQLEILDLQKRVDSIEKSHHYIPYWPGGPHPTLTDKL